MSTLAAKGDGDGIDLGLVFVSSWDLDMEYASVCTFR